MKFTTSAAARLFGIIALATLVGIALSVTHAVAAIGTSI